MTPTRRLGLLAAALALGLTVATAAPGDAPRNPTPILITVDDLPIAAGRLHSDAAERERITRGLLAALARHHVRAVGLATGNNHPDAADVGLLERWLAAGHELGNHSTRHLNYTETDVATYVADVEKERAWLAGLLERHGKKLRYFRFPFLNEGETAEKLQSMRTYLAESGQVALPVTIDNQDWSFEEPWVTARQAGDRAALATIGQDYLAALRLHVRHFEARSELLFGRTTPQILLLHANEVGAAQWDALFSWLEASGHRFADVDSVLADSAFATPHAYVGRNGLSLWDRIRVERRHAEVTAAVKETLATQVGAWNGGDLDAFAAVYAADATFVSPTGLTQGRDALVAHYRQRYPDRAAMGTLAFDVDEVRLQEGDEVSLFGDTVPSRVHGVTVVARWTLRYADRPPATGRTLLVLRPRGRGWEIVQDASM